MGFHGRLGLFLDRWQHIAIPGLDDDNPGSPTYWEVRSDGGYSDQRISFKLAESDSLRSLHNIKKKSLPLSEVSLVGETGNL